MDKYIQDNLITQEDKIKDDKGILHFEYFQKCYKTAMIWSRIKFAEKQKNMIWDRRLAFKAKDMEKYGRIV